MNRKKIVLYLIEAFTAALMILFFFPFAMVIINAAKGNQEIIRNPMAWPEKFGTIFPNVIEIIGQDNLN